jgi:hypothetical protein
MSINTRGSLISRIWQGGCGTWFWPRLPGPTVSDSHIFFPCLKLFTGELRAVLAPLHSASSHCLSFHKWKQISPQIFWPFYPHCCNCTGLYSGKSRIFDGSKSHHVLASLWNWRVEKGLLQKSWFQHEDLWSALQKDHEEPGWHHQSRGSWAAICPVERGHCESWKVSLFFQHLSQLHKRMHREAIDWASTGDSALDDIGMFFDL